jgi:hypothetical protein
VTPELQTNRTSESPITNESKIDHFSNHIGSAQYLNGDRWVGCCCLQLNRARGSLSAEAGLSGYDLFISYARTDDEGGQVAALKAHIESSFRALFARELRVFFDVSGISGMDAWRQTIQQSLRESHLFLAVLSPRYVESSYCDWEWEDYVRYEAMRQCLGEGIAPVFFVWPTVSSVAGPELVRSHWQQRVGARQTFDLSAWHDTGARALEQPEFRSTFEALQRALAERLDRKERARRSPGNLLRHNPAFVGRVTELTGLRNELALNKLSIVGAREGQFSGRVTVRGSAGWARPSCHWLMRMPSRGTIRAGGGRSSVNTCQISALRCFNSRGPSA